MITSSARTLTLLVFTGVLSACGSSNSHNSNTTPTTSNSSNPSHQPSASLLNQDMTGTWRVFTKTKTFQLDTQEYSHESGHSTLAFIRDQAQGIDLQNCYIELPEFQIYGDGRKTEKYFYAQFDVFYELLENGNLFREHSQIPYNDPDLNWREDYEVHMIKISDDFITHSGTFVLSSPISLYESNQTCSQVWYGQTGDIRGVSIIFPYEGRDTGGVGLRFYGPIEPGSYSYSTEEELEAPVRLDLYHSEAFERDLGFRVNDCYFSDKRNVSIEITVFDEERFTGSFSFEKIPNCYNEENLEETPKPIYVEGEFDISIKDHSFLY